jgi:hypothetical protein
VLAGTHERSDALDAETYERLAGTSAPPVRLSSPT